MQPQTICWLAVLASGALLLSLAFIVPFTTLSEWLSQFQTLTLAMTAFTAGLMAALSPCVIVLVPLVLCRFAPERAKDLSDGDGAPGTAAPPPNDAKALAAFSVGFVATYMVLGLAMSGMMTIGLQAGIRIGGGILCAMLGALAYTDRLDPMNLPVVRQPIVLGGSFALMLTINPCTIPFLGIPLTCCI